jgi:hypothetical protein
VTQAKPWSEEELCDKSCMHKLTNLKPLVDYAVAIRAVNQEGEGDWSEEELFKTPGSCHAMIEFPLA